jgi:hypothetical protein
MPLHVLEQIDHLSSCRASAGIEQWERLHLRGELAKLDPSPQPSPWGRGSQYRARAGHVIEARAGMIGNPSSLAPAQYFCLSSSAP